MITMTDPTIGSLCSGYGGLDLAVERFFRARTAWFSEYESAPSKVLAHHWPGVPNLGDMTKIDWTSVPRVRIVCTSIVYQAIHRFSCKWIPA